MAFYAIKGTICSNYRKYVLNLCNRSTSLTFLQVSAFHKQHRGQNAEEAMLEYLKIAQA